MLSAQPAGLGLGDLQVAADGGGKVGAGQVFLGRREDAPILVEHRATAEVEAEMLLVLRGELQRLLQQLVGVVGSAEREEQVRAHPLRLEVGGGQARSGADVFRELRVVLAVVGGLGDADVVFALALEVRDPAVGLLLGQDPGPVAQPGLLRAAEPAHEPVDEAIR